MLFSECGTEHLEPLALMVLCDERHVARSAHAEKEGRWRWDLQLDESAAFAVLEARAHQREVSHAVLGDTAAATRINEFLVFEDVHRSLILEEEAGCFDAAHDVLTTRHLAANALKIQRCFRCFSARNVLHKRRRKKIRRLTARDTSEVRTVAATSVQKTYRGYVACRRVARLRREQDVAVVETQTQRAAGVVREILGLPHERILGGVPNPDFDVTLIHTVLEREERNDALPALLTTHIHHELLPCVAALRGREHATLPLLLIWQNWVETFTALTDTAALGADPAEHGNDSCDAHPWPSLLFAAVSHNRIEIATLLLSLGVHPLFLQNAKGAFYNSISPIMSGAYLTPLSAVGFVESQEEMMCCKLQCLQAVVDTVPEALQHANDIGATCIHYAMASCQRQVFDYLAELGADPIQQDYHRRTPLHYLCAFPHPDELLVTNTLEYLVERHSLPISLVDDKDNTPLHYAARAMCSSKLIIALLNLGASAVKQNRAKMSPLDIVEHLRSSALPSKNPLEQGGARLSKCVYALKYHEPPERQRPGKRALKPKLALVASEGVDGTLRDITKDVTPEVYEAAVTALRPLQRKADVKLKGAVYADDASVSYGAYLEELCKRNGLKRCEPLLVATQQRHAVLQDGVHLIRICREYLGAKV